jgi:hypothetical protein
LIAMLAAGAHRIDSGLAPVVLLAGIAIFGGPFVWRLIARTLRGEDDGRE